MGYGYRAGLKLFMEDGVDLGEFVLGVVWYGVLWRACRVFFGCGRIGYGVCDR